MGVRTKKAGAEVLSALETIVDRFNGLTPEQIRELMRQSRERVDERERDIATRRSRTGKYDPINIVLGKCRFCVTGDLVEKMRRQRSVSTRIGGPPGFMYAVSDGYYCKGCGLRYEFIPKVEL